VGVARRNEAIVRLLLASGAIIDREALRAAQVIGNGTIIRILNSHEEQLLRDEGNPNQERPET